MSSPSSKPTPTLSKPIVDAEEDDLDELDDVLDEFAEGGGPKPTPSAPPPTAATSSFTSAGNRPRTNTRVDAPPTSIPGRGPPLSLDATHEEEIDEDLLSSEFARELAKGMEDLMKEIGAEGVAGGSKSGGDGAEGASGEGDDEEAKAQAKAFKAAWEAMLVEGMNGKEGEDPVLSLGEILGNKAPEGTAASTSSSSKDTFQDKIKQAMEKLKEAESKNKSAAAASSSSGSNPESMEELLKTLGDLGLGDLGGLDGEGGGADETELAGFLESMMGQLMSKDILYEPLKELADGVSFQIHFPIVLDYLLET
ncbi:hypothetical protein NMY22_g10689 [Coprinellus aureogranulatus]|nr:hypothetical protein NMY22_g10689 [Coprinellus aureogranulatus]